MPARQAKDKRWNPSSIYGRRASINVGAFIPGGAGEGDATPNPDFGKKPGDVDFNYKGDPSVKVAQPVVENQGLLQKLRGERSAGQQINSDYISTMAKARGLNDITRGEMGTPNFDLVQPQSNIPPIPLRMPNNPSYIYSDTNSNGILPSWNSGSGENVPSRTLPFKIDNTIGGKEGNNKYWSDYAQKQSDTQAALDKERGLLAIQGQLQPRNTLLNRIASEGLDPNKADLYAQSNEGPALARNRMLTSTADLQNEQNLGQMDTAQDLSRATSGKALNDATYDFGLSGQPDYMQASIKNTLAKLATTGLANQNLSDIKLSPAETLIRGGQQYTGLVPESKQFQNTMIDPKTKISIPYGPLQTTHSYLPSKVSPFSSGEIPANNLNTAAPTNKDNIVPTTFGEDQAGPQYPPIPFRMPTQPTTNPAAVTPTTNNNPMNQMGLSPATWGNPMLEGLKALLKNLSQTSNGQLP